MENFHLIEAVRQLDQAISFTINEAQRSIQFAALSILLRALRMNGVFLGVTNIPPELSTERGTHTPEPWTLSGNYELLAPDGELIAQVFDNPGEEAAEANAALLLAAPKLLKSTKELLHLFDTLPFGVKLSVVTPAQRPVIDAARSALAAAEPE